MLDIISLMTANQKSKSYVIAYADADSTNDNGAFNSSDNSILISLKLVDINNKNIFLSELNIGDAIYVLESDAPNRWVGNITNDSITLYII